MRTAGTVGQRSMLCGCSCSLGRLRGDASSSGAVGGGNGAAALGSRRFTATIADGQSRQPSHPPMAQLSAHPPPCPSTSGARRVQVCSKQCPRPRRHSSHAIRAACCRLPYPARRWWSVRLRTRLDTRSRVAPAVVTTPQWAAQPEHSPASPPPLRPPAALPLLAFPSEVCGRGRTRVRAAPRATAIARGPGSYTLAGRGRATPRPLDCGRRVKQLPRDSDEVACATPPSRDGDGGALLRASRSAADTQAAASCGSSAGAPMLAAGEHSKGAVDGRALAAALAPSREAAPRTSRSRSASGGRVAELSPMTLAADPRVLDQRVHRSRPQAWRGLHASESSQRSHRALCAGETLTVESVKGPVACASACGRVRPLDGQQSSIEMKPASDGEGSMVRLVASSAPGVSRCA